ncbi:fibrinogen-like protein A [Zeugodacus cucurbitae]|nr:fibrinogen-like protein A [Zeugodacus cucurbitae]
MFRFLFIILLHYILIFRIKFVLCENNETCKVYDCICDVEIEIVKTVMEDMKDMKKSTDNIEKQLTAKRASKSSSCLEAAANSWKSGVYEIQIEKINITNVKVFCEEDVDFGGWIVIQRRLNGTVDFNRDWQEYKKGFGDLTGNYWIGLEKLHAITSSCEQELYIQMKSRNGTEYYAKYSALLIADALKKLGNYSGNAGDSLNRHLGYKFSTRDRDNDVYENYNCAEGWYGGWWFYSCYNCFLNGVYGDNVNWNAIQKGETLPFAQMMIRPTTQCIRRLMLSNLNS